MPDCDPDCLQYPNLDEVQSNWNMESDHKLMELVDIHKVENIGLIHKLLNEFIDKQRMSVSDESYRENWPTKSKVECMDRWLKLRNSTGDGTVK